MDHLTEYEAKEIDAMAREVVSCSGGSLGTIYAAMRDAFIMGREGWSYEWLQRKQKQDAEQWLIDHPDEVML